jgi:hypothetical protein
MVDTLNPQPAWLRHLLAAISLNTFVQMQIALHVENQPTRDVLRTVLAQASQKLVWSLLYDIDDKTYYLNLTPVVKVKRGYRRANQIVEGPDQGLPAGGSPLPKAVRLYFIFERVLQARLKKIFLYTSLDNSSAQSDQKLIGIATGQQDLTNTRNLCIFSSDGSFR